MSAEQSPIYMQYPRDQGLILGPFLFNIFINDIPKINSLPEVTTSVTIYADDVQLFFSGTPNNLAVKNICRDKPKNNERMVYSENGLKMNSNKTQCILFTPNFNKLTETFQLTTDDTVIKAEGR